jgi:hypothetical protein
MKHGASRMQGILNKSDATIKRWLEESKSNPSSRYQLDDDDDDADNYKPPSKSDLLGKLKRLSQSGSVEGIRRLTREYKIDTPVRDLNKIVKIEGYKFIKRHDKAMFVKDAAFHKYAKEAGIYQDEVEDDENNETSIEEQPKSTALMSDLKSSSSGYKPSPAPAGAAIRSDFHKNTQE